MVAQVEDAQPQTKPAAKGPPPSRGDGKVRVAMIGCGAATRELHLPVLSGHPGVEVVALVDRDQARAAELAAAYKVPAIFDDSSKLDRAKVDAAVVCTPPFHHAPGSIELARRGFHVLVEKPMATRFADAQEMVRASQEAGTVLSVGVFRRLLPATRMLRGLIDAGLLGRPLSFDVEEGEVYAWPTATLGNHRRDLAGGGVLIDFGSHTMDRLLFFFPGVAEVISYDDNARGGIESDCIVRLRMTTAAGERIEGRVELSRTRNLRNTFRITCERGVLELGAGERYRVRVLPRDLAVIDAHSGEARDYEISAAWKGPEEASWFEAFRAQIDDWLGAIRSGEPPRLCGSSVLPSLKIIHDCYQRTPGPIAEPWVTEGVPAGGVHVGAGPKKRVLVTGATGFIGGRLCEVLHLREGWDVRAMVHNPSKASRLACLPIEMVMGDLGNEADARRLVEGCDAVAHCAIGTAWGDRKKIFDVTVGGTRRLATAALAAGVGRFVHISTFAVHDLTKAGVIDETTAPTPPAGNDYAESKLEADRVIEGLARQGLCAATLRLANVYGPHSTIWITRPVGYLAKGQLALPGPAECMPSSTVYVDTVVEAILQAIKAPADAVKGQLFTISDGDEVTWAEFFGHFARAVGQKVRTVSAEELAGRKAESGGGFLRWATTPLRSVGAVLGSAEMWALTKRVLKSEPLYTMGKWTLDKVPPLKRRTMRLLGVDTPVVYERAEGSGSEEAFELELTYPLVRNDKAVKVLGLRPPVPRGRAMELTLAWLRQARVVP